MSETITKFRGCTPLTREQVGKLTPHKPCSIKATPFNPVPPQLSDWGNGGVGASGPIGGDCVTAAAAFKLACQLPEVFIPRANVVEWAKQNGDWNGTDPMSQNQQMQQSGLVDAAGNKWGEGPANYVTLSDQSAMEAALNEGPLSVTVAANQLDRVAGSASGWILTGATTDTGYDHEPAVSAYGTFAALAALMKMTVLPSGINPATYGYLMFTWGTLGLIDRASLLAIGQDALLCLPTAVNQGSSPTPTPKPPRTPSRRATDIRARFERLYELDPEAVERQLDLAEVACEYHEQRLGIKL